GQLAPAVHPALQPDGRAGLGGGQVGAECSVGRAWCHDYLQWTEALEVWAGAKSRCHHTFADVSSASRRYAGRADPGLSVIERGLSGLTGVEEIVRTVALFLQVLCHSRAGRQVRVG